MIYQFEPVSWIIASWFCILAYVLPRFVSMARDFTGKEYRSQPFIGHHCD